MGANGVSSRERWTESSAGAKLKGVTLPPKYLKYLIGRAIRGIGKEIVFTTLLIINIYF